MKSHWSLDPDIVFLNHGSFGATPREVLAFQSELRERMEREPVLFLARELEALLDEARAALASFLGADAGGLVFVPNATAGVNAVLRSLDLDLHDELLVTSHEYTASRNAVEFAAGLAGARVIAVDVPFPIDSPETVLSRILERVSDRTRLVLVDHVTSQTGLIFPVERIVAELDRRGIDTLIDGAHAPGMLPLDLSGLNAAYYTGNLHKWVCAPKGAAFLHVRKNRRASIRPTSISHGASSSRRDRSRFLIEFDWTGTLDPTAWLSVPKALEVMDTIGGGWTAIMAHNHTLAIEARNILAQTLGISAPAPDSMLGSMAALPLPDGAPGTGAALYGEPPQQELFDRFRIEVPVVAWPSSTKRVLRVSAQLYNERSDYERLAAALATLLGEERQRAK